MAIIYIIAIIHIMHIIIVICHYYTYACYCNYAHYYMSSVKDGWNLSALRWFQVMSLTTRNLSCTSFPFRRPPDGCWRWMQDVVRQLVGFGLVAGHVMNLKGSQRAATHVHATSMHTHVWAMLTSALHVLYRFRSILPAVHSAYKLWPECAVPYHPRR
jgi:hypothetical protein